ncbi:UDP-glucuronosyltransferase 2A2 isoform X7 [Ornithorhynchus anatinus]|uniref:UDP-glucuronosyltransferase 2A2 isoform X7 n=1 Tax=Ornithorhynchus anatinus TaxID=9258 RepID=UPI0010A75B9A|nr:UDP-glucuronosyltransferase 2A2 isoform X7 [Ornithorhynchus anatinus]
MVVMFEKWVLALIWLQLSWSGPGSCGKVLVWPMDHSHWINLKFILNELASRGHNVTVLVPSMTFLIDPTERSALNYEVYPSTFQKNDWWDLFESFIYLVTSEMPRLSSWQGTAKLNEIFLYFAQKIREVCRSVALNQELRKKLQEADFDVLITDPAIPCGELIAEILEIPLSLGIPFVYTLRFSSGYYLERHCGKLPSPLSYVPLPMGALTDRMDFKDRVKNVGLAILFDYFIPQFDRSVWDGFYTDLLGRPTTLCEIMGKAEMWLIRTYWDFEFPRPYLPNFEFVGGLHCQPAKPLPEEMEAFVQSSGEHGIVVFSLGSMVKNLTEEKANLIAAALAQIPQKVLWRYKGKQPATLGPNTKLYDWIPQNDLLGHPKTKAFITHGGTNGIYEAIYHGVPMVGIPMFADQPDNIAHMKAKGAAAEVDFSSMTTDDLLGALDAVINEASYKESALRLSRIHHDQPTKPLDRAVFWIEFVMRHKGAKHLRPASHSLTWYQYHCLDVVAFLLGCAALGLFVVARCCLFCCGKLGRTGRKRKRE